MMMKHDKEVCHIRADNIFKSMIRSGFYPVSINHYNKKYINYLHSHTAFLEKKR